MGLAVWLADASQPDSILRIGKMIKERLNIDPEQTIGFNIHNEEKARPGREAKKKVYVKQYHYIIIIYSQHSPGTFFYITLDLLNFSELLKRNLPSENVNTVCQKKKDQFLIER